MYIVYLYILRGIGYNLFKRTLTVKAFLKYFIPSTYTPLLSLEFNTNNSEPCNADGAALPSSFIILTTMERTQLLYEKCKPPIIFAPFYSTYDSLSPILLYTNLCDYLPEMQPHFIHISQLQLFCLLMLYGMSLYFIKLWSYA